MKRNVRYALAAVLVLVLLGALAATSFVSARPRAEDLMESHLITIPEGSSHPSYYGDYITSDQTIYLTTGWSTDLPYNTCAIMVQLSYMGDTVNDWATVGPTSSGGWPVTARTVVAGVWSDRAGMVPVVGPGPSVYLNISDPGYVYLEIFGYWLCDDYVRPTPAP